MHSDMQKYCDLMEEIKRRTDVIDLFLSGRGHALYEPTTLESIGLQVRKILELIAFGSLVANRVVYSAVYSNFAKHWHAGRLLRDLAKVNSGFYPRPIVEISSAQPGVKSELKDRDSDYLTKDDFEKVYDECGPLMHAANPYAATIDYKHYQKGFPIWRQNIINLLNCHRIQLVNDPILYLVHMREDRDNRVHYYAFQPTSEPQTRV